MASSYALICYSIERVEDEIRRKEIEAEVSKSIKFIAARKIQSWFRGVITRKHIRTLHHCSTLIQACWRGYRTRVIFTEYVIWHVSRIWQDYYDQMATRIQAAFRGYYVRKTILNIAEIRRWLASVYAMNEGTLDEMKNFRNKEMQRIERATEHESMLRILFILFKLHPLLRTKQRPGFLTKIDKENSTVIEEMLRCLEFSSTKKKKMFCHNHGMNCQCPAIFCYEQLEKYRKEIERFEERNGSFSIFGSSILPAFKS